MFFQDEWVVCYNTGAGEYSDPYFVPASDQSEGCFGGHGHTSYALFGNKMGSEAEAKWFVCKGRQEAEYNELCNQIAEDQRNGGKGYPSDLARIAELSKINSDILIKEAHATPRW